MSKHWKKNLIIKKNQMEEFRENVTAHSKEMIEVVGKEPDIEPAVIELAEYKLKFATVQAHRLAEKSTVHCADERKLFGEAGDYYVQLDRVQEFILPADVFRKMFLLKTDK